jgi:hypothetical protein
VPSRVNFFELTLVPIAVAITISALPGFTATIEQLIVNQVVEFLSGLPIGYNSFYSKLVAACQLPEPDGLTYDVTLVTQRRDVGPGTQADVVISYIEACTASADTITMTINTVPGSP